MRLCVYLVNGKSYLTFCTIRRKNCKKKQKLRLTRKSKVGYCYKCLCVSEQRCWVIVSLLTDEISMLQQHCSLVDRYIFECLVSIFSLRRIPCT